MSERPGAIYMLTLLWIALCGIFIMWGQFSLDFVIQIPSWENYLEDLMPMLHFGYLISTIVWFVFAAIFIFFAYATFKRIHWIWTSGIILTTIFLAIFGLMLAAFMINALMFRDLFSVLGLVTVVCSFLIDIAIVFFLTRPVTKLYFQKEESIDLEKSELKI